MLLKYAVLLSAFLLACTPAVPSASSNATDTPAATASPGQSAAASEATAADLDKFKGEWGGPYQCDIGSKIEDKIRIEADSTPEEVKMLLFIGVGDSPVKGKLSDANTITIPAQEINGGETSGSIHFSDGKLTLKLMGLGATCEGKDYNKLS